MKPELLKKIKSAAIVLILVSGSMSLQSCTDEEVGTALTVVAAAAIVANSPSQPHHGGGYDGGYNNGYNDGYDNGYGNGYQDRCYINGRYYRDYDCRRYRGRHSVGIQSVKPENLSTMKSSSLSRTEKVSIMSEKYGLTAYAAEKLQTALEKAQVRDFSVIDEMGIAHSDLQNLYENKSVSRYTRTNLSAALGITFEQTNTMIEKFQQDIQTVKSASQMM